MPAPQLFLEVDIPDLELTGAKKRAEMTDDDAFFGYIVKALDDEMAIMQRMFNRLTEDWRHQPRWTVSKTKRQGQDIRYTLWTKNTPFVWVSGGHSGGRVALSKDYIIRTRHKHLRSKPRGGRVLARGMIAPKKKAVRARRFELRVVELREKAFQKKAGAAFWKGAKRLMRPRKKRKIKIKL